MKRIDEEISKTEFDHLLKDRFGEQVSAWVEVRQEHEPPNYYVNINDCKYAVEVTSIWERLKLGGRQIPSIGISQSLSRFTDEIKEEANSKGTLLGAYVITYSPMEEFGSKKDCLKRKILEFFGFG